MRYLFWETKQHKDLGKEAVVKKGEIALKGWSLIASQKNSTFNPLGLELLSLGMNLCVEKTSCLVTSLHRKILTLRERTCKSLERALQILELDK